jgi:hypothetical protein
MNIKCVFFIFIAAACLLPVPVIEAQNTAQAPVPASSIPPQALRPAPDASLIYARDVVIGDMGQGTAPDGSYPVAREALDALLKSQKATGLLKNVASSRLSQISSAFEEAKPTSWRIGGGKVQDDGSVSFLFRFLGPGLGVSGEIYLVQSGQNWLVDDVMGEDPRDVRGREEAYPYDFSPYERF